MQSKIAINTSLVKRLIASQFPQWAELAINPVEKQGWDNRTFHLGNTMLVRLPSAERYAEKVEIEQRWLPKLAPHFPLQVPVPVAMGKPSPEYPWHWSIYKWIDGETASRDRISNLNQFAQSLAQFLTALESIDATNGPPAGPHNFYRGGSLKIYDSQTREAINLLQDKIDTQAATAIWNTALSSEWHKKLVWVHGDIEQDNLLVKDGTLHAVIDFGGLGVGDPACDLAIAWSLLDKDSRKAFRQILQLDDDTWARGRGWALWKALIVCAQLPGTDSKKIEKYKRVLDEILFEYQNQNKTIE